MYARARCKVPERINCIHKYIISVDGNRGDVMSVSEVMQNSEHTLLTCCITY